MLRGYVIVVMLTTYFVYVYDAAADAALCCYAMARCRERAVTLHRQDYALLLSYFAAAVFFMSYCRDVILPDAAAAYASLLFTLRHAVTLMLLLLLRRSAGALLRAMLPRYVSILRHASLLERRHCLSVGRMLR